MKFTYNWLKDFVDCALSPQDLGERLTMAGLEVKDVAAQEGDYIFEAEITSNRPDWLSVRGIAREVAALTGKRMHEPSRAQKRGASRPCQAVQPWAVRVSDAKDCPFYTATVLTGVSGRQSPDWLRRRLELIGCRSVNAIVDVTNYIMFEYGTPLHAFDLALLSGTGVSVRRAASHETIVTIDGTRHQLTGDMLVIADAKRPVALAGIMGGKDTEVSDRTSAILLEAAVFNPVVTRRTRQSLGLTSESAYRFERGVDAGIVLTAAQDAARMIIEVCGGNASAVAKAGAPGRKRVMVTLDPLAVSKTLGVKVSAQETKKILTSLGFSVSARREKLGVAVPSFRGDVAIPADLIEEVARIHGYERVPASVPVVRAPVTSADQGIVPAIRRYAAALGLVEVITYSTVSGRKPEDYPRSLREGENLELVNPLAGGETTLRQTLIPSLVDRVAYNLNQGQERVFLFEISSVFSQVRGEPKETLKLGIVLCGIRHLFLSESTVKDKVGLAHVKGIVESLGERCGIDGLSCVPEEGGCAYEIRAGKESVGVMGMVTQSAREAAKIKNRDVFYAEVDVALFSRASRRKRTYKPLPKFPSITRDISCAMTQGQSIEAVLATVRETAGAYLKSVRVTDYYTGKQIAAGHLGVTLSCVYRADDRTLTEEDIEPVHASVCAVLVSRFAVAMR